MISILNTSRLITLQERFKTLVRELGYLKYKNFRSHKFELFLLWVQNPTQYVNPLRYFWPAKNTQIVNG
jgi:hypothetical protein